MKKLAIFFCLAFITATSFGASTGTITKTPSKTNNDTKKTTTTKTATVTAPKTEESEKSSEIKKSEPEKAVLVHQTSSQSTSKTTLSSTNPVVSGTPINAVSFNPLGILFNLWMGSYERAFNDKISAKINLEASPNVLWTSDVTYFAIEAEGRYYVTDYLTKTNSSIPDLFLGDAVKGPYIGAGLSFVTLGYETTYYKQTYSSPGISISAGDKIVFGKNAGWYVEPELKLRLGFGKWEVKYKDGYNSTYSSYSDPSYNYSGLSASVGFGYAF